MQEVSPSPIHQIMHWLLEPARGSGRKLQTKEGSLVRQVHDLLGKEMSDGLIEQLAATLTQFQIDTDTPQIRLESCLRILCVRKMWAAAIR